MNICGDAFDYNTGRGPYSIHFMNQATWASQNLIKGSIWPLGLTLDMPARWIFTAGMFVKDVFQWDICQFDICWTDIWWTKVKDLINHSHRLARSIFIVYAVFQNLLGLCCNFFQFDHAVSTFYLHYIKIASISIEHEDNKFWFAIFDHARRISQKKRPFFCTLWGTNYY